MSRVSDFGHLPVMPEQVLELLNIREDGLYVDCTLGGGGHSAAILAKLGPQGRLISIDRDLDALQAGRERLVQMASFANWQVVHGNFSDLAKIFAELAVKGADGILADLGVSSWQLDQPDRGFGYSQDGPLDMRMDRSGGPTAADLVNSRSQEELVRILRDYGEERYADVSLRPLWRTETDSHFVRQPNCEMSSSKRCRQPPDRRHSIRPGGPFRRSASKSIRTCRD
jgi:16S rRNA (cytosine1402-N4)-methyltransferase